MNERIIVGERVAIYPRGKRGIYHADYHYRGQHRRTSLKTSNRKIAVQRATVLAGQILAGTLDEVPTPSTKSIRKRVLDAVADYRSANEVSGLRAKTIQKYHGTLTAFCEFAADKGATRLDQVSLVLIDAYQASRSFAEVRGKKVGATQKYHDLSLLKRLFAWCVERDLVAANPLEGKRITRPTPRRRLVIPSIADVNRILEALRAGGRRR